MAETSPNRTADAIRKPHVIQVADDESAGMYCDQVAEWVQLTEDHPDTPVKFCMFCGTKLKRTRSPSPAMKR